MLLIQTVCDSSPTSTIQYNALSLYCTLAHLFQKGWSVNLLFPGSPDNRQTKGNLSEEEVSVLWIAGKSLAKHWKSNADHQSKYWFTFTWHRRGHGIRTYTALCSYSSSPLRKWWNKYNTCRVNPTETLCRNAFQSYLHPKNNLHLFNLFCTATSILNFE